MIFCLLHLPFWSIVVTSSGINETHIFLLPLN